MNDLQMSKGFVRELITRNRMKSVIKEKFEDKTVIRKCHCCGQVIESKSESAKCLSCGKSFLPLNYFTKIHDDKDYKFNDLFCEGAELHEDDLIKGLYVLW